MSALTHPEVEIRRLGSSGDVVSHPEAPTPFYRVSVKALVFDADERLLVVQEPAGHWELPGGGWEHGETLEQCLDRELGEELDVHLGSVDLSTQRAWTAPGARRRYHRLKVTVHATLDSPLVTPVGEILDARWVTPAQFAALPMPAGDAPMREHILGAWASAHTHA